jgi:hypothetical protein
MKFLWSIQKKIIFVFEKIQKGFEWGFQNRETTIATLFGDF